ncbi:uncharacterized protein [Venturia canescens]|uniref:uncharacterized protein n=1 Tax=Venturia canescens TaxID=32260 RepID=UPI001C9C31F9|nr:uncharacterized protein LOC122407607 [Venturia canescens]
MSDPKEYATRLSALLGRVQAIKRESRSGAPLSRILAKEIVGELRSTVERLRATTRDEGYEKFTRKIIEDWDMIIRREEATDRVLSSELELLRLTQALDEPEVISDPVTRSPEESEVTPVATVAMIEKEPEIVPMSAEFEPEPDFCEEATMMVDSEKTELFERQEDGVQQLGKNQVPPRTQEITGMYRRGYWNCGDPGHKRSVCPEPKNQEIYCYDCGYRGVTMKTCPYCRAAWLIEGGPLAPTRYPKFSF